jgi:soluble lytic murein transglycosylase
MTLQSRTYSLHRSRPHRRVVARRVRALAVLAGLLLGAVLLLPLIQRVIAHFELPLQYASIIRLQAAEKHLDPALIAAVIYAETRFEPRTSDTGAEGLMQIEPQTANFLARRSGGYGFHLADLDSPSVNIAYGSYYLRYLLNLYSGSTLLALAAYNGGETNVDRWLQSVRAEHRRFTIADIPLTQTRAYVGEVLAKERAYRARYARQLGYG